LELLRRSLQRRTKEIAYIDDYDECGCARRWGWGDGGTAFYVNVRVQFGMVNEDSRKSVSGILEEPKGLRGTGVVGEKRCGPIEGYI